MAFYRLIVRVAGGCNAVPARGFNMRWMEHNEAAGSCVGVLWCSDNAVLSAAAQKTQADLQTEASRLGTVLASHPDNPAIVGRILGAANVVVEEG